MNSSSWSSVEEKNSQLIMQLDIPVVAAGLVLLLPKPPKPVLVVFVLVLEPKPPNPPPNDMLALCKGDSAMSVLME